MQQTAATSPSPAAGTSPQALVAAGVSAPSKLEGFSGGSACRMGAMGKRDYGVETSNSKNRMLMRANASTLIHAHYGEAPMRYW